MCKKVTSSDSMMNSVENNRGETGVIRFVASMPLSAKLCLLVLAALIPRIIAFLQPQIITNDGVLYVQMAKLFSEGKYSGTPGPYFSLYPLLIFLVQKFVGNWELSGQLISMTLATLTVIPVFLLGRSLFSERIGWLSALFYIVLPNFLKFDTQVLRDPTLWFFITLTLWFVWDGVHGNRAFLLGLGSITAGLGAMTRIEGIVIWFILILYTALKRRPSIPIRRRSLNLVLLALLFPILLSPSLLFVEKHSTQAVFDEMTSFSLRSVRAYILLFFHPQDPVDPIDPKTYDSLPPATKNSLELARRHRFVLAIFEVIFKFVKSANLLILFIVLGLWKRKKEGFESPDRYLIFVFAGLLTMSMFYSRQIYYFSTRHGLTLVLPLLYFAGIGLISITEVFSSGIHRIFPGETKIRRFGFHLLTLLLAGIFLAQAFSPTGNDKMHLRELGVWLKENGYQGSIIMGPEKCLRLAFYADATFLEMPDSWNKVIDSIREDGVRILVVDTCTIEKDCRGFLENWSRARLSPLQAVKVAGEECKIQAFAFY